jgi:hypothetical protein
MLEESLAIDEGNILTVSREHAVLYVEAARYREEKTRDLFHARDRLDTIRSKVSRHFRKREANSKMTETALKEMVVQSKLVIEAQAAYNEAEVSEHFARWLLDAYAERGRMIRIVANLIGAEVAVENWVEVRKAVHDKYGDAE